MNVHCDGAWNKVEIRTCKRSSHFLRVPTVIESAIGHRVAGWENLRALIINHRDADFVQLPRNFREPLLAQVSRASAAVPPIHICTPTKWISLEVIAGGLSVDSLNIHQ